MDYQLVISPNLKIDVKEFVSSWNQDPESKIIAQADTKEGTAQGFPMVDPELLRQGVVFLAGVASTVALDVLKDLIKIRITKFLENKSSSEKTAPKLEVAIIPTGEAPIIVIRQIGG
jgi:hypothetical protein